MLGPTPDGSICLCVSVDLTLGSVVQGSVGLFKADFGEWIYVRQHKLEEVPELMSSALRNLKEMGGEPDPPLACPLDPPPADTAKDLRDRLRRPSGGAGGVEAPRGDDVEAPKGGDQASAGMVDDCRTLPIDYDEHGEQRFKRWRSVSREAKFHKFEDWPFEDSNSQMLFLIKHWDRHGEDG